MSRSTSPIPANLAGLSIEEREKKLAEERAQNALKLQRKQRLEALIRKRKANLLYLKKIHIGDSYWLNSCLLTKEDIINYGKTEVSKQKLESYFILGLSIARILEIANGFAFIRAFSQLIEEWEYYYSGAAMQGMKYMMAKGSPCVYPNIVPTEGLQDIQRPGVYKFLNNIVYEHLQLMNIPFELDYRIVLINLCEMIWKLYDKLFYPDAPRNQVIYDAIVRLDARMKHHVINAIAKDLTEKTITKMKTNTTLLRGIFDPIKQQQLLRQTYPQDQKTVEKSTSENLNITEKQRETETMTPQDTSFAGSSSSSSSHTGGNNYNNNNGKDSILRTPSKSYQKDEMQQFLAIKHSLSSASGHISFSGIHPTTSMDFVQELSPDEILSAVDNDGHREES